MCAAKQRIAVVLVAGALLTPAMAIAAGFQVATPIKLEMGSVDGSVVDYADVAVADAKIAIVDAASGSPVAKEVTDLNGKFTVKLAAGTYYLSVVKDTVKEVTTFSVYAGIATSVKVKLPSPPMGSISGIVTDLDGRPVANAEIVAINAKTGESIAKAETAGDGRFGFRLPAGAYEIYAFKDAATAKTNTSVESGKTTIVKLQIFGKLTN